MPLPGILQGPELAAGDLPTAIFGSVFPLFSCLLPFLTAVLPVMLTMIPQTAEMLPFMAVVLTFLADWAGWVAARVTCKLRQPANLALAGTVHDSPPI